MAISYEWGDPVFAFDELGRKIKAIYISENYDAYYPDDGKHLVILESEEEVCEVNRVVKRNVTKKPHKGLKWGDLVVVYDDKEETPLVAIFLNTYNYPDETLYVAIPKNFTRTPSEGYLNCERI